MEKSGIQFIAEDIAIRQIVETIRQASPGEAPFVLIVGAGFSYPFIPTATGFVNKHLPQLDKSFVPTNYPPTPTPRIIYQYQEAKRIEEQREKQEFVRRAASFWKKFLAENAPNGWQLELDRLGIPRDVRQAYKYAFHDKSRWPFQNRAEQRKFLRQVIQPNRFRLNDAHFMLASILGAQPDKDVARKIQPEKSLFNFQAAFSRCILTTNFDPFLQIALQAVNRLYFMSDTPHLENEDLTEEQTDAIHLVYVHGSIHRHRQDNNDEQINEKKKIALDLVPLLEKHGIIIIGYNGWDDAIVEALVKCEAFSARGLFWVDLQADPLVKGAFGEQVSNILRRPNTFYVQAKAGPFMNQLHSQLVKGMPRLLENPIAQLRELLTVIDFGELEVLEIKTSPILREATPVPKNRLGKSTFKDFKNLTLQNLKTAEDFFVDHRNSASLTLLARYAFDTGRSAEAIEFCDKGLAKKPASREQAAFYELRAYALMQIDRVDDAFGDLKRVIEELPEVPSDIRMHCLQWRASLWFEKGKYNETVIDLTTLIKSSADPDRDHQVGLHFWRAKAQEMIGGKNNLCRAIVDYNYIIKLPYQSPPNEKERAYYNRAVAWAGVKQYERAIADYTKVIESLPKTYGDTRTNSVSRELVDLVARSLCNRGYTYGWRGSNEKSMGDFKRVIENLPGVSDERKADALSCRGWLFYTQDDFQSFLRDEEAALQNFPLAHHAMYHLGLALLANGRDSDAFSAYQRAAKQYPNHIEEYGLFDLRDATTKWLTQERAKPCIDFLENL